MRPCIVSIIQTAANGGEGVGVPSKYFQRSIRGCFHIHFQGPSMSRKTMTTGYSENITHSGADGTAAYERKLKCLAVLADCDVEYIKRSIDFWMSDHAGDCVF